MKMNLTTDKWIPIVWQNGQAGVVSLAEAYQLGKDIQDLAVRPHERIALMRLLICVAQAALDGPNDHAEWKSCCTRIAPAAVDYLKRWHHAFELFGDKQRFLQVSNLKLASKDDEDEDGGNSVSKLDLALATGNNSTLFDNAGGSARSFTPTQLVLMLLTFQCFSPCGTIGVALWNEKPTLGWKSYPKVTPGMSDHAPCIAGNMLHAILRGSRLIKTIHLNLLDKETIALLTGGNGWGKPVWEQMPKAPTDSKAVSNATSTYLGRLVPIARALRLNDDAVTMLKANGLKYPPYDQWREPACTIVVRQRRGQSERAVLGASLDRAMWRELHALTVRRVSRDTNGGPVALQNVPDNEPFDIWVGALVAAGNGKLEDVVEAVFGVPANMLTKSGQGNYENGVGHAQELANRLSRTILFYRKELGDDLTRRESRDQANKVKNKAAAQYWTDIERDVQRLLEVVADPTSLTDNNGWPQTIWGKACWNAAMRAFDVACPLNTPRQLRAYALARHSFFHSIKSDNTKDKPKETEA
jgi:CRISPR system Cascade subunit CasA